MSPDLKTHLELQGSSSYRECTRRELLGTSESRVMSLGTPGCSCRVQQGDQLDDDRSNWNWMHPICHLTADPVNNMGGCYIGPGPGYGGSGVGVSNSVRRYQVEYVGTLNEYVIPTVFTCRHSPSRVATFASVTLARSAVATFLAI